MRHPVIAAAYACLPVREEPRDSNAGPMVEAMLATVGLAKGQPWCAAFVAWCGVAGFAKDYPFPKTGGCADLAKWAASNGRLVQSVTAPCVFLLWFPTMGRFAHTGFVVDAPDADGFCATIEGNSNDGGSRDGYGVFLRRRKFKPEDRFITLPT